MATFPVRFSRTVPQPVLILCADGEIADELVRELAGRCYQPLVGRPNWSWKTALEWARPVAAVVDAHHPAAHSDGFLAASSDLEVGVVLFGEPELPSPTLQRVRAAVSTVPTVDTAAIGGAVDATVRRRLA